MFSENLITDKKYKFKFSSTNVAVKESSDYRVKYGSSFLEINSGLVWKLIISILMFYTMTNF